MSIPEMSLCPHCGRQGPLGFDVYSFISEIEGPWESPSRMAEMVQSPRYLGVVCGCAKSTEAAIKGQDLVNQWGNSLRWKDRLEKCPERIDSLEALVKRIATHLGVEG